jgi:glutamine phosphoribosylpyrophosphate amidotransferase
MCGLFGIYNYSGKSDISINNLVNCLAREAMIRGTDATGISYVNNGHIAIYKRALPADEMKFEKLDDVVAVIGHTRHSTQGSEHLNYNNHPFKGECDGVQFSLAHNGVLWNDHSLKREYDLPYNRIQTDSYIAVQLLEHFKTLSPKNIIKMSEAVQGSYSFSILDSNNTLTLVKGDSPITLLHFPQRQLYIYASTDSILYRALIGTTYFADVKKGLTEEVKLSCGEIWQVDTSGNTALHKFTYNEYVYSPKWYDFKRTNTASPATEEPIEADENESYIQAYLDDIKSVCSYYRVDPEDVDALYYDYQYTLEEIEEYVYGCSFAY